MFKEILKIFLGEISQKYEIKYKQKSQIFSEISHPNSREFSWDFWDSREYMDLQKWLLAGLQFPTDLSIRYSAPDLYSACIAFNMSLWDPFYASKCFFSPGKCSWATSLGRARTSQNNSQISRSHPSEIPEIWAERIWEFFWDPRWGDQLVAHEDLKT